MNARVLKHYTKEEQYILPNLDKAKETLKKIEKINPMLVPNAIYLGTAFKKSRK